MTYEQALSFVERIKDIAIGAPLEGRVIQSLAIGPTDWEQMSDFLNEFSHFGKSLSVYGISVTHVEGSVPNWEMIVLDDWEMIISN